MSKCICLLPSPTHQEDCPFHWSPYVERDGKVYLAPRPDGIVSAKYAGPISVEEGEHEPAS